MNEDLGFNEELIGYWKLATVSNNYVKFETDISNLKDLEKYNPFS